MSKHFLQRCLLFDLETSFDKRILKIGAVYRGETFVYPDGTRERLKHALDRLDHFAAGAELVLGHNVIAHDLPVLEAAAPESCLLRKPAIDTLYLSALAFPENPYHRLVKGYKLVREAVSDPVADAGLAARLFADAWQTLAAAARTEPVLPAFYAFCFGGLAGLNILFSELAGRPPMTAGEARDYLAERLRGQVCGEALTRHAARELAFPEWRPAWGFAAAWLAVAGSSSVLPHWVAAEHPHTPALLDALRGWPCAEPGCSYCRAHHDLEAQLRRFFDLPGFRSMPAAADGGSLQRRVAARLAESRPLLAILPTGSGKSLCYQLPALIRHRQRGQLTVVLSPLQALMQDQVAHLNDRTGLDCAAAINGLLTPPERGATLEQVRLGGVAVLYVSPEQLRNVSFCQAIEQRERNPHVRLIEEGAAAGTGGTPATAGPAAADLEVLAPALERPPDEVLARRFALLGLGDLFLDFAGRRPESDPIHARLARLRPGDLLTAQAREGWIELLDATAGPVAALSQGGREAWAAALGVSGQPEQIRVVALVERRAADSKPEFQSSLRCQSWLVPVVELRYRERSPGRCGLLNAS
jgi:hypothetical protein